MMTSRSRWVCASALATASASNAGRSTVGMTTETSVTATASAVRAVGARTEIRVGRLEAVAQRRFGAPAERRELRHVEQLARRSVRARRVEHDLAVIAHDVGNEARELRDRDVLADADVEEAVAGKMFNHRSEENTS